MTKYAIGIDGGGTSCRAAVADATGRILGRGRAGAANIMSDASGALENIVAATRSAFLSPKPVGCPICILTRPGPSSRWRM